MPSNRVFNHHSIALRASLSSGETLGGIGGKTKGAKQPSLRTREFRADFNPALRPAGYRRRFQFFASWIAANTTRTTAMNHMRNDSHPEVIIAMPTNKRASAASRSAGANGHCGGLGEVIGVLSTRKVNLPDLLRTDHRTERSRPSRAESPSRHTRHASSVINRCR